MMKDRNELISCVAAANLSLCSFNNFEDKLSKNRHEDIEHFKEFILNDAVQNNLALYLENLKKKSSKK